MRKTTVDNPYCMAHESPIHGTGLIARKGIKKGTRIIEYVGEKITKNESNARGNERLERSKKDGGPSVCIFELDDEYDLDGDIPGNIAKYINHSCEPNCESEIDNDRIFIYALKNIKKGEELVFDYGYDLEHFEDHPCHCGEESCAGYIVSNEQRGKLRKLLEKRRKRSTFDNRNCEVFQSAIHGSGVRARKNLKAKSRIIEYIGEKISKDESNKRGLALLEKSKQDGSASVYIFDLDKNCDLDGDIPGNVAKYINHSCEPNCEAENDDGRIWILALRDIKRGEELSFDYGYSLSDFMDHPCRCGKPSCVGYIVAADQRGRLKEELRKIAKSKRRKAEKAENKKVKSKQAVASKKKPTTKSVSNKAKIASQTSPPKKKNVKKAAKKAISKTKRAPAKKTAKTTKKVAKTAKPAAKKKGFPSSKRAAKKTARKVKRSKR